MVYQNTFKRRELKYLVTAKQKRILQEAMAPYMEPDPYGRSTICSLYFDTSDYLLARRSSEHPIYKEKLRVRSYGTAGENSPVFVELKKKYRGVVYKRRIGAAQREAMDYLCGGGKLESVDQIAREIDYFKNLYRELAPAVYLSCEREAYFGVEDGELRITFDDDIIWRDTDLSLCVKPYGTAILQPGYSLMEVKLAGAMPLWLCGLLSENSIFMTGFSKYGSAYRQILENREAGTDYRSGGKKYA